MGTAQWLMIPVSRFKYVFLSLLVVLLALAGLIGGRAYYLARHPEVVTKLPALERATANSTPLTPSVPNAPMPAGGGVFDQIAAEVS